MEHRYVIIALFLRKAVTKKVYSNQPQMIGLCPNVS